MIDFLQHLLFMLASGTAGLVLAGAWIGGGVLGLGLIVVAVGERLVR